MNKNIIIVILVVLIIALGAFFVLGQNSKVNTEIKIINNETFQNGEQLQIELKDAQGKAVSGQMLNISFNNQKYSITTDQNGKVYLNFNGLSAGKYDVEANYTGNDKYNGCSAKESITITDEAADNPATNSKAVNITNNTNNTDPHAGCYFVGQYELWVRSSDNVVVEAPGGRGVGLTLSEWVDKYVNDDPVNQTKP
ncbi:MAG: Ig-like domain repeat protein [Methanobrevibacter sp.]|nr:Ig-like domain repeat protein [Methanobrevibacter sp.]